MVAATMTVGGAALAGEDRIAVVNPATERVVGHAPACTPETLGRAIAAAEAAFPAWCRDEPARRAALRRAAEAVDGAGEELAQLLTLEQGKPLREARVEAASVSVWLRYYAGLDAPAEVLRDDERTHVEVVQRPLGPVAAITPWNFPISLASWKIAPALRAGNTVVCKPSPHTPLATLRLGELLNDVLPPGVLNVVSGDDELGRLAVADARVRKVSFTGSTAAGKRIAAATADDLKRLTLELGGNDAAVVLDDADPARIAKPLFWAAFSNNGQVCTAIKRLYVPASLADPIVDALAELASRMVVGDGLRADVRLGPLCNAEQRDRVAELVDDARTAGARIVVGGRRGDGPGWFYEPTIVADAADGMRVVDEEQFGPVLPIVIYRDVDDAIARANGTRYGLTGSVWSEDLTRAADVADALECGIASVNLHAPLAPEVPFGGWKWSGIGLENGLPGLQAYLAPQVRVTPR